MWRAAVALVLLTLIQALVGIFTVYALLKTLKTQLEELGEARKISKAQRAYIFWDNTRTQQPQFFNSRNGSIGIILTNAGQSPALNVRAASGYEVVDGDVYQAQVEVNTRQYLLQGFGVGPSGLYSVNINFTNEEGIRDRMLNGQANIICGITVEYNDIFSDQIRKEEFSFRITIARQMQHSETGEIRGEYYVNPLIPDIVKVDRELTTEHEVINTND